MAGSTKGPLAGSVNMMPLIDILFQIVIFFLIAAQIQVQERSLPIVLPQASAAMPLVGKPKEFFVHVDREGRCFAGGVFIDLPTLEKNLNQAAINNPQRQSVVIRADKKCEWEHVVAVMNICNKVGISDYRVTTAEPGT
jgi:biopolymer transport protein ExbD